MLVNGIEKEIKLIISDFDGVMTDNRVLVDENGKEAVFVNRSDGLGIGILKKKGIDIIILSTEKNPVVSARARKLNIECIQGVDDKARAIETIAKEKSISLDNIAYIGNDLNDLEAMKMVGLKIAPTDAYQEILDIADITTNAKGGYGVIREVSNLLL